MKPYLILLLLAMIFIAGCMGNSLEWIVFDSNGKPVKKLKINNLKGMVNVKTKSLAMSVTDGNDFKANLLIVDSNVTDSPESARAIGDMVANIMTAGASGVAGNLTEIKLK